VPRSHLSNVVSAGFLVIACSGPSLPAQSSRESGPMAGRMLTDHAGDWRTIEVTGADIHVRRGSAADRDAHAIGEAVTAARREALALLGGSRSGGTVRAQLFFLNARDDMQRMTGRPLMGFVQEDEPTGVFVYAPGYRLVPLLRHELTHLYSFQLWGPSRAGTWLVEGLGAWATGTCQGHTNDELASGALARGEIVPLAQLAKGFREVREDVAMPEAGSIVGFLVRQSGLADIRDRWGRETPHGEHPLGADGAAIERAWLEVVGRARPATLDVPRVIKEGC
jgi:hypothetical protein